MAKKQETLPVVAEIASIDKIQTMIHIIRGERVMLDHDLAVLYGVETKMLNKQVKRNIERFPSDFMFQLDNQEIANLRFQNDTSSWGGARYKPYAFTEEGVAMLSGLLRSPQAIQTNIQIMRAFVYMKNMLVSLNQTTLRQDKLELEVEKLKNYMEDVLRDQNDTNEDIAAQMEAISQSLVELGMQVDSLVKQPSKTKPNPVGYEAIEERDKKK